MADSSRQKVQESWRNALWTFWCCALGLWGASHMMSEGFVLVHMHIESEKDNLVESRLSQKWCLINITLVKLSTILNWLSVHNNVTKSTTIRKQSLINVNPIKVMTQKGLPAKAIWSNLQSFTVTDNTVNAKVTTLTANTLMWWVWHL